MKKLGENYFSATKRIQIQHNKMNDKPEVAAEIDLYIKEQVNNRNDVQINRDKACQHNQQLHVVGYNFGVSSTSSST